MCQKSPKKILGCLLVSTTTHFFSCFFIVEWWHYSGVGPCPIPRAAGTASSYHMLCLEKGMPTEVSATNKFIYYSSDIRRRSAFFVGRAVVARSIAESLLARPIDLLLLFFYSSRKTIKL